jgi:predicted RNase H-like HicB family nuclease
MRLRYTVTIVPEEDGQGYYALVPALPGCFSQGATVEETQAHVVEAIALHVQALRRARRPVPRESRPALHTVVSVLA